MAAAKTPSFPASAASATSCRRSCSTRLPRQRALPRVLPARSRPAPGRAGAVQQQREAASFLLARLGEGISMRRSSLPPETTIREATRLMQAHEVSAVLVRRGERDRHLHRTRCPRALAADGPAGYHADRRSGLLRPADHRPRRLSVQCAGADDRAGHPPRRRHARRRDRRHVRASRPARLSCQFVLRHRQPA